MCQSEESNLSIAPLLSYSAFSCKSYRRTSRLGDSTKYYKPNSSCEPPYSSRTNGHYSSINIILLNILKSRSKVGSRTQIIHFSLVTIPVPAIRLSPRFLKTVSDSSCLFKICVT